MQTTFGPKNKNKNKNNQSINRTGNQFSMLNLKEYPNRGTIITYREYIDNIALTTEDQYFTWTINPGDPTGLFPWLSTIAPAFEKWRCHRARISYVSTCASTTAGTVYFNWVPDPMNTSPTSIQNLMSAEFKYSGAVWASGGFNINPRAVSHGLQDMYIRTSIHDTLDLRLTDLGKLNMIIPAGTAVASVGQLFIDYTVELLYPQAHPVGTTVVVYDDPGVAGLLVPTTKYGDKDLIKLESAHGAATFNLRFKQPGTYSVSHYIRAQDGGVLTYLSFGNITSLETHEVHSADLAVRTSIVNVTKGDYDNYINGTVGGPQTVGDYQGFYVDRLI